jgi:hypothetical protein
MLLLDIVWAVTTSAHWAWRMGLSALLGIVVAFSCFEMLIWIDRQEDSARGDPPNEPTNP